MKKNSLPPCPLFDSLEYLANQVLPETYVESYQTKDYEISKKFLLMYQNNGETFKSYRRELERLLQWSWLIGKKSILSITAEDIQNFIYFCQKPKQSWIGTKHVARFIVDNGIRMPNPKWRLFVAKPSKLNRSLNQAIDLNQYKLSQQSVVAMLVAVSSFYSYLLNEHHVEINPVKQIRQKSHLIRKQQSKRKIRRLSEKQWRYVVHTAQELADNDPDQHERTLFIISTLYLLYLRISELVSDLRWQPQMGHFYKDSRDQWWFKTVSKGNKERDIMVPEAMLDCLKRYRTFRGLLSPLPLPNEETPLIINHRTQQAITSTRNIRLIVQKCFDLAVQKLLEKNETEEAIALQQATVHWLRHTGISDDINKHGRPINHVRDDAGHSSSAITDLYNDADLQARHLSGTKKTIV